MAKTKRELDRDIAVALERQGRQAHATKSALSTFHRSNIPEHRWEDVENSIARGETAVRKIDRATKVTDGGFTTYYYRGVAIDQDPSVPSGYYGRWRARGIADDSLQHVIDAIDARLR